VAFSSHLGDFNLVHIGNMRLVDMYDMLEASSYVAPNYNNSVEYISYYSFHKYD
jgi:hypothetical protein